MDYKVDLSARVCSLCHTIEDEVHFLINCPRYNAERTKLYSVVDTECPNFVLLNDQQKMCYLLTTEGEILKATAKYCHAAFEKHSSCPE